MSILLLTILVTHASANEVSLEIDEESKNIDLALYHSTSYVPIRAFIHELCPTATVSWVNHEAVVTAENMLITARPENIYMIANGRVLYIEDGIKLINGSTMVPIRVISEAVGALVSWDDSTKTVRVSTGSGTIESGESYYDSDSVYWLSRIIHAESGGEPLKGKIAVGNVLLNRVESPAFPESIYNVIFDTKWGVQFQPTRNGSINNTPNEESVLAAKLCLDGANVAGNSLYFLNQRKASSFWIMESCEYVATIGNHQFYE